MDFKVQLTDSVKTLDYYYYYTSHFYKYYTLYFTDGETDGQ